MSHHPIPPFQLKLVALLLALLFLVPALPAAAQTITVFRGGNPVNDLYLGNDLWVGVSGASANTKYHLRLIDEASTTLAIKQIMTDAQGKFGPGVLWSRSGVIGCFDGAVWDPLAYIFRTFEDAETLSGRSFKVLLTDPLTNAVFASKKVDLVAYTAFPRFYYSDGAGCPRFTFLENEQIYIAAIHLPFGLPTLYRHWASTTPIDPNVAWPPTDMRPEYPNGLVLVASGTSSTLVALAFPTPPAQQGCIFGIVENNVSPTGGGTGAASGPANRQRGMLRTGTTSLPTAPDKFPMHPTTWPGEPESNPAFNCPPCVENNTP